jgi:hypothetical protein
MVQPRLHRETLCHDVHGGFTNHTTIVAWVRDSERSSNGEAQSTEKK